MSIKNFSTSNYFSPDDFYAEVKRRIVECCKNKTAFSIATLDIDHFNYINDLFGYETGDLVLRKLTEHFSGLLGEGEVFSRLHADIFAFCVNFTEYSEAERSFLTLTNWQQLTQGILPPHYNLTASGGIVVVQEDTTSVSALLDRANYARQKSKRNMNNCFRFYDQKMSEELQWQKVVTFSMESALENREFTMYLQPKILIKSDQIVGAEALVRWVSPQYGIISPDRFIPILEQNGFIRRLDFFMLEEACRFLKENAAQGIQQIPISINFSKAHLKNDHLVEQIFQTVNQIGIETKFIEIEFTESLSVEGFERLIEVIGDLKLLGFRVSLDDFGSAYSSLNCLKELPLDIIKIDKGFLKSSADTEKGKMIIAKVVELIKSLRMLSVMEGVENAEQVDFLRKLSCDFGQGYFYAKPMPVSDYIEYLKKGDLFSDMQNYLDVQEGESDKSYLNVIPQEFQMDNWELYTLGKNIDMGLMKGYLDGEATVQYVNDRALEYLGYTRQEFRTVFHNSIKGFTHPDDASIVQKNAEQLITTGKSLAFQTRAIRKDGKVIVLRGRSSCVIDGYGRPVGLYAFQDVTEELERADASHQALHEEIRDLEAAVVAEREAREALRLSEERYRIIIEQREDAVFDWDFASDTILFSEKYAELFRLPLRIEEVMTNVVIRENLHPDDLPAFEQWLSAVYRQPGHYVIEFRNKDAEGKYVWLRCHSTAICNAQGDALRAMGIISNITEEKNALAALTFKSQRDPLTKLLNKEETCLQTESVLHAAPDEPGVFFMMDIDNFKGLNDNLGHQLGDAVLVEFARKISDFFPECGIVGRIGGDEIAVYLPGFAAADIACQADALLQTLRMSYYGSAAKYNIYASIGISCYPIHGKNFEELYHCADIALYESKRGGKDCYTIYQDHMTGSLKNNRTPVEWSERFLDTYFQDDFSFKIFEMLYETKDVNASIHLILELLGKRFQVDRVYIFQNDQGGTSVSNTHEWCASGISSEMDTLQNLVYADLGIYLSQYNQEGVFCCPDIRHAIREVYEICEPQGIKSLLHCAIYNEGVKVGFIGFDMCTKYHTWTGEEIAILGYISRILSVFLIKSDTALRLRTSYENYVEMVENLNGYVYVVDPATYQLLYVNKAVKGLDLDCGQTCYHLAFGASAPCSNCPMHQLSDTVHYAVEEIYSKAVGGWVSSAASKLKWTKGREAVLICCTDISKYKKDTAAKESR